MVQTQWKLSNMAIAKLLRPEEIEKAEDKSFFTDKIVRARKKLTEKWVIPKFNWRLKIVRGEVIERIRNKVNSGETNQQIADAFWLTKEQVDNLTRQMRKEDARKLNY